MRTPVPSTATSVAPDTLVPSRDTARHPIRRASTDAGVHPQTLREYERRGLLRPERTGGGMRLYRDNDIEIARRIRELTDTGYAFAAIGRILSLERRVRTLIAHVRVLEDQNIRLSNRLTRRAS